MNPIGPTMPPAQNHPEPARKSKAAPPAMASAQSPERKRKRPPADSPERKKNKGNKSKRNAPPAELNKKALPFQRAWTPKDEVRILKALAAHRQEQGKLPSSMVLFPSLDGVLDRKGFGRRKLQEKMRSLRRRYDHDAIKGTPPTEEHECRLYHLSKNIWGDMPNPVKTSDGGAKVQNSGRTFDEMHQLYPCLAQEVMLIVDEPAVLERVLPSIDDSKAHALDYKINELRKELTNAINESARMQSIEVPIVWQYQCGSAKLEPVKSRAESDNIVLLERLDKVDGACIRTQEQLARVEHQMLELKEIIIASQSSPKILQSKVAAQKKLPHGKNKEISQRKIVAQKSMPRARKENIDAESQILHDEVKQRKVAAHARYGFSDDRNEEIQHGGIAGMVAPDQPSRPGAFCV